MANSYNFTQRSASRIDSAVKWVERQKRTSPHGTSRDEVIVPFLFRRFELKEVLTPGQTAEAYMLTWSSSDNDYTVDEDVTFDVSDMADQYRGRGRGDLSSSESSPDYQGSRGWAIKCHDGNRWEIVEMQPAATMISCLASAANTGTSTISVDTVAVMEPIGGLLMASITSVVNRHTWTCDDNAKIEAVWNEATEEWWALQVDCPA